MRGALEDESLEIEGHLNAASQTKMNASRIPAAL